VRHTRQLYSTPFLCVRGRDWLWFMVYSRAIMIGCDLCFSLFCVFVFVFVFGFGFGWGFGFPLCLAQNPSAPNLLLYKSYWSFSMEPASNTDWIKGTSIGVYICELVLVVILAGFYWYATCCTLAAVLQVLFHASDVFFFSSLLLFLFFFLFFFFLSSSFFFFSHDISFGDANPHYLQVF
jgi:hypothetical protein